MNHEPTLPLTAVVQIGNSDDKLTQNRWAHFYAGTKSLVHDFATAVHFGGYSPGFSHWQNACWVFEVEQHLLPDLREHLAEHAFRYDQDSIALTLGPTEFVERKAADNGN